MIWQHTNFKAIEL